MLDRMIFTWKWMMMMMVSGTIILSKLHLKPSTRTVKAQVASSALHFDMLPVLIVATFFFGIFIAMPAHMNDQEVAIVFAMKGLKDTQKLKKKITNTDYAKAVKNYRDTTTGKTNSPKPSDSAISKLLRGKTKRVPVCQHYIHLGLPVKRVSQSKQRAPRCKHS